MSDCCENPNKSGNDERHLVILGGGSAAFAAATKASELGGRVTIVNDGLPIGGTCVNVGCVPSKTLIRAAEAHHRANHHGFEGIRSSTEVVDFEAVIAQKRQLVEQLRQAKYLDVVADLPSVRIVPGRARFISPKAVEVNGESISADRFLIATGAGPHVPSIPGLKDTGYLTNETAFELDELPPSLIVLGGRYIALECAQMFARFGSRVTVLQRSDRILPTEMPDLTDALTTYLADEGVKVETGITICEVRPENGLVVVATEAEGNPREFHASNVLVATGRRPNTHGLGLEQAGVALDHGGFVQADETLRTTAPGVFAAGDVLGEEMFVYTAAYEGSLAAENALLDGSTSIR